MNYSKLTAIVFGLLLFGCQQADKNPTKEDDTSIAALPDQTIPTEKTADTQKLNDQEIDQINKVIALFKEHNVEKISSIIQFPFNRSYPIPPIKNKEAFKQRFAEVFDPVLVDKIAQSEIGQWSKMGWRGIMLDNGVVWMANADGRITAVNYQTDLEKKRSQEFIDKEKHLLPPALKTFKSPTYKIKTKNQLIRIDEMTNGSYRYAAWKVNQDPASHPALIIENGALKIEGSGGNHVIDFAHENSHYKVYRNLIGEKDTPAITLKVEKDGQTISSEDGILLTE